jgi:4-diphosphocytidyl-2-C-methyl-D-erythritol kinase
MPLTQSSPCKINLLLNILGKRPDGFHALETVFHPIGLTDELTFERGARGVQLSCSHPTLPVDGTNLVQQAAAAFLTATGVAEGVRIHLEKRVPLAAGLGGGSSNAAHTLLGLNELFGKPLRLQELRTLAEKLGSDVPFFLQSGPALGLGRGEQIFPLEPFACLQDLHVLLIHPGFGISTGWAYRQLAWFPEALHGQPGRAQHLVALLRQPDLSAALRALYNSLETPVLVKYPILALFQDFLRTEGAVATLMSGSGSTTIALLKSQREAENLAEKFRSRFGANNWLAIVPLRAGG